MLFIRFTHKTEEDLARFKYFIHKYEKKFITCLETHSERPHTHTLLWTDKTIDQFRKQFKAKFKTYNGNADYSIEAVKSENEDEQVANIERYVCKGETKEYERFKNPVIVDYFEYNWELIEIRHKEYWEKNKVITEENSIKKKKKEGNKNNWTKQIIEEFMKEDLTHKLEYNIPDKKLVFDFVVSRYGKMDKGFDQHIIRRVCNGIWNKIGNKDFSQDMFTKAYPEDEFAYNQYYK